MKTVVLVAFLMISGLSFTQSNLEFSQVITYTGAGNSAIWTVPSGKVWKIESVLMVNMTGVSTFRVNNFVVLYNTVSSQPIWLKAGDNCQFAMSSTSNSYILSIIEYTVVP